MSLQPAEMNSDILTSRMPRRLMAPVRRFVYFGGEEVSGWVGGWVGGWRAEEVRG